MKSYEEMKKHSKIIHDRGEILYAFLRKQFLSNDELMRDTPLLSHVHAGLMMILDTYKTEVDLNPYKDYTFEFNNLRDNFNLIIRDLENYSSTRQNGGESTSI